MLVTNEDDTSVSNPHYFDHLLDDPGGGDFSRFRYGVICDPDAPDTLGRKTGCRSREDSPYLHPIGEYVDFLRSLKPDPARITIAGIYGDPSPVEVVAGPALVATCRDPDGDRTADGEPAVRLADLVSAFGDRAVTSSVCGRDYPALDALGELALRSATRRGCFARPIADTSSVAPGLQPDCEVDVTLDGFDPVPVPACRAGTSALALCWRIAIDPTACPDGEHDRLELAGPGPNPAHLRIRATCDVAD